MVMIKFVLAICLIPFILFSQEVKITSQIEGENYIDTPMHGVITITHPKNAKVDPNSFLLKGKPLQATYQKDVVLSPDSPIMISIYEFQIPGEKKGLHFLPEISVKVAGQVYASTPSTYEVTENKNVGAEAQSLGQVVLGLEPFIDGPQTLYPGQRIKVGYRYIYNYNFSLTKEEIPLLEAQGFRKIGDKQLKESTRNGVTALEITQVIEAEKPGTYTLGPSVIQGKAYREDAFGNREYTKNEYTAQAPIVILKVDPFPERNKPASFKGAIGEYTMELKLLSPPEVSVGDNIQLQITISGTGVNENIPMPDICCQPGFSGFFKMSDLPPVEKVEGSKKIFIVEMRPLTDAIHEIPPLEFSFFNPETITYSSVKTKPIPIKVLPLKEEPPKATPMTSVEEPAAIKPNAIEIEGNYSLSSADLSNKPFGTWWVLFMIPMGALILFLQYNLKSYAPIVKPKTSHELFQEALQLTPGSSQFYNGLLNAFVLRLFERGEINTTSINTAEELPKVGLPGEVRAFLKRIEELRFAGQEGLREESIVKDAKILFAKLGDQT